MKCKFYKYQWEVVGWVGGCALGLFGGFHLKTCNGGGNCPSFLEETSEVTIE